MRADDRDPKPRSQFRRPRGLAALLVLLAAAVPTLAGCQDSGGLESAADSDADTDRDASNDSVEPDADEDTFVVPGDTIGADIDSDAPAMPDVETLALLPSSLEVAPVVYEGADTRGVTMREVVAADVDDDGFLDLVGITEAGEVYVSRLARQRAVRPPFDFLATEGPFASGVSGGSLATGDFDADGRTDLIVVRRAEGTGQVAVLLNLGLGHLSSPVGFEDPIFGFEDPIFGAERPELGANWQVGDLDGNGHDDLLLVSDTNTLALAMFGPSGEDWSRPIGLRGGLQDLRRFEDPIFGFEDPIFGMPRSIQAVQLDDDAGLEIVLGLGPNDQLRDSELVFFEDPIFGFEDPIFGLEDPLVGFGRLAIPGTLRQVALTRFDDDPGALAQADLVALSNVDGTTSVVARVDLAGFEDPIFGAEATLYGVAGVFDRVDSTRLIGSTDAVGSGGSGLPAEPISHLMLSSAEGMTLIHGFDTGEVLARAVENPVEFLDRVVVDFNRDGFGEFIAPSGGFRYVAQEQLEVAAATLDDHLYSAETQVCTVSAPLCSQGTLGVCAHAHTDCSDACAPVDGDSAWYESFESGDELQCDGLDNNCDGLVDVHSLGTALALELEAATTTGVVRDVQLIQSDTFGLKAVVQVADGGYLSLYHGVVGSPLVSETALGTVAEATGAITSAHGGGELAVVQFDGVASRVVIFAADGTSSSPATLQGFGALGMPVFAAGRWTVLGAQGGSLVVSVADPTAAAQTLLELTSDITGLSAVGTELGMMVALRTAAHRLLVLELEARGDDTFALRDVHQLVLGENNTAETVRIGANADAAGVVRACVSWAERGSSGPARLFAMPLDSTSVGLRLGRTATLSHHGVDPGSLELDVRDGRCQVAWVEPLSTTSDAVMLRQAYVSADETLVQDLAVHPSFAGAALAVGGTQADLVLLEQPALAGGSVTLRHSTLCR